MERLLMNKRTKRRATIIPTVLHALLIIIVFIFQAMFFPHIRIGGLVPLLLPIVSTGMAVYQGRHVGGISGLFAGILCDLAFNQPLGMFTVLLSFTGVIVGILSDNLLARRFGSSFISCAVVLSVCAFAQLFPLLFFVGVPAASLINVAIGQTVYSMIFVLPLWFFIRALARMSEKA
jgi:rod shape-determining protein MreD